MFYVFLLWKVIQWIFYVIFPVLAKLEMDQLVDKNEQLFWVIELNSFNIFLVILFIIFSFRLLEDFLKSFIELFEYDYVKMYDNYYSEALYKRLENVDPWIFLNSRNKRFVGDILWNASQIWDWLRRFIWNLISNIFVIIWVTTVLALINFWIFIVLIVSSFIIYYIERIKQKYSEKQKFEEHYDFSEKLWILSEQMRKNLSYLMASGWFRVVLWHFSRFSEELRKRIKLLQKRNLILNLFSFVIENLWEIGVKIIVWYSIFFSTTSVWTMTLTLLYVGKINELFNFIRYLKFDINDFQDSLLKLDVFLDITSKKKDKKLYLKDFNSIEFKNLHFSYPNFAKEELKYLEIVENRIKSYSWDVTEYSKNELHMIKETKKEAKQKNPIILKEINLKLETWNTYWLVWKNWAWKTTLTSLLLNYFDSYKWNIFIGNNELKDFSRDFFIDSVSVISQIPYIIEWFTVRENLLLWVTKNYSDDDILNLLDKFWIKNKILKNRLWLDSKVGYENDFSGWEKQLIALIRVILQDRKILIMDEWTNQLDAENELLVMNELLKHKKDKIVIFITHRMTTIRKVDIIYCLEDWEILHFWSHKELIWWNNLYNSFWKKQVEE